MRDESRSDNDVHEAEAKVLPTREALSLISTDPLSAYGAEDLADVTSRLPDSDAEASGGSEESVTGDDRTVQIARTDTASSET